MRRFLKLWRYRAAKSRVSSSVAISTGKIHSLPLLSMPPGLECRQDLKLALAAEMLRFKGSLRLRAWGSSMLPSVWPGDLLTIERVAQDEVVPGDIILVLRNQRPFIHRLVQKRSSENGLSWITRGDAMPDNDPPTAASELLGRVTSIDRGNRSFVPSRQISQFSSAVAWTLFRFHRFLGLAFKMKAASPEAPATRNLEGAMPGISPASGPPR
jgi:signal peptidase I